MILHDVPDCTSFLIKLAPPLYPELLRHRDLHAFDVVAVPDGLKKRIGKTKKQEILNGFFPEIVVNTKDCRLVKQAVQRSIQSLGGSQIASEGFFHDDSCARGTTGLS